MRKNYIYTIIFLLGLIFVGASIRPIIQGLNIRIFNERPKEVEKEDVEESINNSNISAKRIRADRETRLSYKGLEAVFLVGSVEKSIKVSVRKLENKDLKNLPHSIVNVTQGVQGYRFRPRGFDLEKEIPIEIAYDKTKVPEGYTEEDIDIFYFDLKTTSWKKINKDSINIQGASVSGKVSNLSDFIAGIIKVPESPDTSGFTPTSISGLKAADPLAGVQSITSPTANPEGGMTTSFSIELPKGRLGIQPSITMQYSTDGGHSWLGQGWNLSLPSVSIDTRWGAPRYDVQKETESYILGGEELIPNTHRAEWEDRSSDKRFYPRREGAFSKIIRKGNHPNNYSWEVSSKNGVVSYYGITEDSSLGDLKGNKGFWTLKEQKDLRGNTIHYEYIKSNGVLYPKAIYYTGKGNEKGKYSVHFITDKDLGETLRKDVQVSARLGFKQEYNRLLRKIEVKYTGQMVRSYELIYKKGAYEKTLLSEIKVYDAENKEFYTNKMDYYDDIRDSSGRYAPFSELKKWNVPKDNIKYSFLGISGFSGNPTLAGTSNSTTKGVNFRLGVGTLKDAFKEYTIGGGGGSSWGNTQSKVLLQDIDGDNLPDKIYIEGNKVYYRKNLSSLSQNTFGELKQINLSSLGKTRANSYNYGVDLHLKIVMLGYNRQISKSITDSYFMDFNGDGLVDFANKGTVYYNRLVNGVPTFSPSSTGTPAPVVNSGRTLSISGSTELTKEEIESKNPLHDVVRTWTAPYTGTINVKHQYQLIEDTSDERKEYKNNDGSKKADGVILYFQHRNSLVWKEKIGAEDYTPKTKQNQINIQKGEMLYFRVSSGFDGNYDKTKWLPEIEYTSIASGTQDINGLDLKTYQPIRDALYSSERYFDFSSNTIPRLKGIFSKGATTDRVELKVYKVNLVNNSEILVTSKIFDESPTIFDVSSLNLGSFSSGEMLSVRVESPTEINWQEISFAPEVEYFNGSENRTDLVNVNYGIYRQIQGSYLPVPIPSSQAGLVKLALSNVTSSLGMGVNGEILLSAKQEGKVVSRTRYRVTNGVLSDITAPSEIVSTTAVLGKNIYLEMVVSSEKVQEALQTLGINISMQIGMGSGIYTDYPIYTLSKNLKFGQLFRGWGSFVVNGNKAGDIINQSLLVDKVGNYDDDNVPDTNPNNFNSEVDQPDLETSGVYWVRTSLKDMKENPMKRYIGLEEDIYLSDTEMQPSRLGENDLQTYLDTSLPVLQGGSSRALYMITESKSNSYSIQGSVPIGSLGSSLGAGVSFSDGESKTIETMSDFNGDRFPDFIMGGEVQYTNPIGGISSKVTKIGYFNKSKIKSAGKSINGGYSHGEAKSSGSLSVAKSIAQKMNINTQGIKDADKVKDNLSASGANSYGEDYTQHTYTDVNGDGLADRITDKTVSYNTGYGFLTEENWDFSKLNSGESTDFSAGLGYSMFGGSFSGGVNYTRSVSDMKTQFIDITGDGLADRIVYNENDIKVYQNLGNQFSTNPISFPKYGKISQNKSVSMGGGVNISIPIPLLVIRFNITAGGSYGTNTNRMEATLMDIDGDGHLDYVISEDEDDLRVGYSNFRRTNMLKGVKNASGNSWEVDYELKAPTYENPNSAWVLKEVKLFDGHTGDGEDYSISRFSYENPYYDRRERSFYGYQTLKQETIDPQNGQVLRTSIQEFYNRDYFRKSLLKKSYVLDKNNQKLNETEVEYHIANGKTGDIIEANELHLPSLDATSVFIAPKETTERNYENATAFLEQKEKKTYDAQGNITQFIDEGNGTPESTFTARVVYYRSETPYYGGIAKDLEVRDSKGLVRKRGSEINPSTGELIKVKNYFTESEFTETDLEYDEYGNLKSVRGGENEKGQRSKLFYEYDAETHSHITSIKDQFGYENQMVYDFRFNTPIKTTDRNGETMTYTLDSKGRIATILAPKEAKAGKPYTIKYEYQPIAYGLLPTALTKNYDSEHDRNIETHTYSDGLGRVVQVKKTASIFKGKGQEDEEKYIVSGKQVYDAMGRVVETYYPITMPTSSVGYTPITSPHPPTKTIYDEKDRVVEQIFPDGSKSKLSYSIEEGANGKELKTESTDALGRTSIVYADAKGQKTKVVQPTGIETKYEYSAIGEVMKVTDAEGHHTLSEYDLLGRRTKLIHPDAGTTLLGYDKASNLIRRQTSQIRESMPDAHIVYNYDYNRLKEIQYPKHPDNNVRYHYGKQEEAKGRRGRLWLVEDASGGVEYFYGDMGEVEKEIRTVRISASEVQTYITEYKYDSWNRIQSMVYPDGERLDFGYNIAGNLTSLTGHKQEGKDTPSIIYPYIKQQGYDEFEQKIYRRLGNDTETTYSYDPVMRRLSNLKAISHKPNGSVQELMSNRYSYDLVGNILKVENAISLPPSAMNPLGGSSEYNYQYDELNRLIKAKGNFEGQLNKASYELNMQYNRLNSITEKSLMHKVNGQDKGYTLSYEYNDKNHPHAPSSISPLSPQGGNHPSKTGLMGERKYTYDGNGNPLHYEEDRSFRSMVWDEENRLRGINDNGRLHLYTYDHTGERVMKSSAESSLTLINGATTAVVAHNEDYTAYISPYFVVQKGKFTKHYFEGATRIVSKLGEGTFSQNSQKITAGGIDYKARTRKEQEVRDKYIKGLQVPPGPPTQHGIYASPEWTGEPYPSIDWSDISQDQEPPEGWPRPPKFNEPGDVPGPPVQYGEAITNANVKAGFNFIPNGVEEKNLYFYHPDHLGSSSYITDREGRITQHTEYIAFGEVLFEEHSVSPSMPYLFNGKELDTETGLYYYGARYYDAKTSIFLNVDPLVEKTGTPYAYVNNNPINLIDPTGMSSEWHEDGKGNLIKDKGDNAKTLRDYLNKNYKDADVSQKAADKLYATLKDGKVNINQLNPETLDNNIYKNYPGPWNPRKYNGKSDYVTSPTKMEIPAFIHDKDYDEVGAVGAKGLLIDTKTIEADKKFVKSMRVLVIDYAKKKEYSNMFIAVGIGEGLNLLTLPKRAIKSVKEGFERTKQILLEAITPPASLTRPKF